MNTIFSNGKLIGYRTLNYAIDSYGNYRSSRLPGYGPWEVAGTRNTETDELTTLELQALNDYAALELINAGFADVLGNLNAPVGTKTVLHFSDGEVVEYIWAGSKGWFRQFSTTFGSTGGSGNSNPTPNVSNYVFVLSNPYISLPLDSNGLCTVGALKVASKTQLRVYTVTGLQITDLSDLALVALSAECSNITILGNPISLTIETPTINNANTADPYFEYTLSVSGLSDTDVINATNGSVVLIPNFNGSAGAFVQHIVISLDAYGYRLNCNPNILNFDTKDWLAQDLVLGVDKFDSKGLISYTSFEGFDFVLKYPTSSSNYITIAGSNGIYLATALAAAATDTKMYGSNMIATLEKDGKILDTVYIPVFRLSLMNLVTNNITYSDFSKDLINDNLCLSEAYVGDSVDSIYRNRLKERSLCLPDIQCKGTSLRYKITKVESSTPEACEGQIVNTSGDEVKWAVGEADYGYSKVYLTKILNDTSLKISGTAIFDKQLGDHAAGSTIDFTVIQQINIVETIKNGDLSLIVYPLTVLRDPNNGNAFIDDTIYFEVLDEDNHVIIPSNLFEAKNIKVYYKFSPEANAALNEISSDQIQLSTLTLDSSLNHLYFVLKQGELTWDVESITLGYAGKNGIGLKGEDIIALRTNNPAIYIDDEDDDSDIKISSLSKVECLNGSDPLMCTNIRASIKNNTGEDHKELVVVDNIIDSDHGMYEFFLRKDSAVSALTTGVYSIEVIAMLPDNSTITTKIPLKILRNADYVLQASPLGLLSYKEASSGQLIQNNVNNITLLVYNKRINAYENLRTNTRISFKHAEKIYNGSSPGVSFNTDGTTLTFQLSRPLAKQRIDLLVDGVLLDWVETFGIEKGPKGDAGASGYTASLSNPIVVLDDEVKTEAALQNAVATNIKVYLGNTPIPEGTAEDEFTLTLGTITYSNDGLKCIVKKSGTNLLTFINRGNEELPVGQVLVPYIVNIKKDSTTSVELECTQSINVYNVESGLNGLNYKLILCPDLVEMDWEGNIDPFSSVEPLLLLTDGDLEPSRITLDNSYLLTASNSTIPLLTLSTSTPATITADELRHISLEANTLTDKSLTIRDILKVINTFSKQVCVYKNVSGVYKFIDSATLGVSKSGKDGDSIKGEDGMPAFTMSLDNDSIIYDDDASLTTFNTSSGAGVDVKVGDYKLLSSLYNLVCTFPEEGRFTLGNTSIVGTITGSGSLVMTLGTTGFKFILNPSIGKLILNTLGKLPHGTFKVRYTVTIPAGSLAINGKTITLNNAVTLYKTLVIHINNVSEDGSSFNLLINSIKNNRGQYTISANQILGSKVIDLKETKQLCYKLDGTYSIGDFFVTTDLNNAISNSVNISNIVTVNETTTFYLCRTTLDSTLFDLLDAETIIGIDDVQGLTGKIIRFRGDWNTLVGPNASSDSISFEGYKDPKGKYIDIVTAGDEYYECLNSEVFTTNSSVGKDYPTQEDFDTHLTTNWVKTEKSEIVATKVLLADNADIKFSQGQEIRLQDDDDCIVGGARGGKHNLNNAIFWAGSLINPNLSKDQININDAPFLVLKDGTLKASKAEISGKITDKQGISVISPTQELYIGFDGAFNPEIALYSRSEGLRAALQWNLASLTSAIYYLQSLGVRMTYTEYPNWYFISTSWLSHADLTVTNNLPSSGTIEIDKELFNELIGNALQTTISSSGYPINTNTKCLIGPFTLYLAKASEIKSFSDIYKEETDPKTLIYAEYWGRLFTIPTVNGLISTESIIGATQGDTTSEFKVYHELTSNCPARIYGLNNNAIGFYLGTSKINNVPGCNNIDHASNMTINQSRIYKESGIYIFKGYRFIEGDRSVASNGEGYNIILSIDLIKKS